MTEQLTLLEKTITIPGVTLHMRGMEIVRTVSDQQLPQIGHRLLKVRGFMRWALGSLFAEMTARKGETWLNEFCEGAQIDPKDKREILGVHTFYAPDQRTLDLSYEHYREAMWGVDDGQPKQLDRALSYLAEASNQGWSVTQLRRHIRAAQATAAPCPPMQTEIAGYGAVYEIRRFAKRELGRLDTLTPESARLILDDLGPEVLIWIEHLQKIAGGEAHV